MVEIAFTDHAPDPSGYDPKWRMDIAQFPRYEEMVKTESDGAPPHVMFGIEADYYPGCESFLRNWLPAQAFDIVLGSVHYIDSWPFDSPDGRSQWTSVNVKGAWQRYFDLVKALVETGLFDVIAHLDLPKKYGHRPSDRDLYDMASPVLDAVLTQGSAIEINTAGLRKPVAEIYPSPQLLQLAAERGIPVTFGSDAHEPGHVGADFDKAETLAREAGYRAYATYRERCRTPIPF
jgi:histidinol-phosphatase (PHP family)